MEKVFDDSDLKALSEMIKGEGVDDNAIKLLRIHSYIDVRLEMLIQDLNRNDPDFLEAVSVMRKIYESPYFDPDIGFKLYEGTGFIKKLEMLSSFDLLPEKQTEVLRRLNTVRNDVAHNYKQRLTEKNIEYIFDPVLNDPKYEVPDSIRNSSDINIQLVYHLGNLILAVLYHHQAIPAIAEYLDEQRSK